MQSNDNFGNVMAFEQIDNMLGDRAIDRWYHRFG
jgi:hypothetical protein